MPVAAASGATINVNNTTLASATGGPAGASTNGIYFSTKTTLDGSTETLLTTRAVGALAPGGSDAASTSVTLPTGLASGTYYIIAQTDYGNAVVATNETNNARTAKITIK